MTNFLFENAGGTRSVEFLTDYIDGTGADNFTVQDIIYHKGTENENVREGFHFRQLAYTVAAFKKFAVDNSLTLKKIVVATGTTTTIVS